MAFRGIDDGRMQVFLSGFLGFVVNCILLRLYDFVDNIFISFQLALDQLFPFVLAHHAHLPDQVDLADLLHELLAEHHVRVLPPHHANIVDDLTHQLASLLIDPHNLLQLLHIVRCELTRAAASNEEFVDELVLLLDGDAAVEEAEDGVELAD